MNKDFVMVRIPSIEEYEVRSIGAEKEWNLGQVA